MPPASQPEPGRDALVYDPSKVSWAVAEAVSMPPSSLARIAVYLTLLLVVGAVAFAHLTSISITVKGRGAIRTSAKIIPIRAEVGGRVAVLNVENGSSVKKGQILVEMQDQLAGENLERARALIERLDALVAAGDSRATMTEAGVVAQEPMRMNVPVLVQERARLAETINALYQALRGVHDVPEQSLADKAERDAAEAKIQKIKLQGLAADLANELAELEQKVTRLNVSMRSRRDQAMQRVSSARGALEVQIRAFEQALELHIRSQRVLSPADGVAVKVAVSARGELLTAGQTLLEIIPDGGNLVGEVQIANRDIAQLKLGMPVDLRLDAMPYQDFGSLPGRIIEIPPDATVGEQGGPPTYVIRVSLDRISLDAGQGPRPVLLGMAFEAEVEIRRRTLLELAIIEILKLKDEL